MTQQATSGLGAVRLDDPHAELARLRGHTMWQALSAAAAPDPDKMALIGADDAGAITRISYADLLTRIRAFSAGLASIGVRRGDRLVVWMTNTTEWVVATFGAMRIGAAVVPVNTFLRPPEIKYFMEQSGARHLVMIDAFRKLSMPDILEEICPGVKSATTPGSVFSPDLPDMRNIVLFSRSGGKLSAAFDFVSLASPSEEMLALSDRMEAEVLGSDLGMVKYTSGSTAFPKGVMLEQGGILANGILHGRGMGVRADDVYFSMMPFFHAGGSIYGMMSMLMNGGTLLYTEAFDAGLAADLIVNEKATIQVTMLAGELMQAGANKGYTFDTIRMAGLSDDLSRRMMPNVTATFSAFGLTETYAPVALSNHDPADSPPPGAHLLPGNLCRIVDPETGLDQPPGVPGEALLKGNIARGYWNKPVESAKAFDADGWFHSEDLCTLDEQGRIKWVGRLKLMLKVGGENVSIEEVERVAIGHEDVMACGAVGVPDPRKGEAVGLYVQPVVGREIDCGALGEWLKPQLAHFKLPREIVVCEVIPHLGSGKVDRVTLASWAKEQFGG